MLFETLFDWEYILIQCREKLIFSTAIYAMLYKYESKLNAQLPHQFSSNSMNTSEN
jgi:hypothetical protein